MRPFQRSHLYSQVSDSLANRIASGEFPAGSLLPNEFALAQESQVSVGTVRKAVELLVAEGLVVRKQGRGTIVSDPRSIQFSGKFDRIHNADGSPIAWEVVRFNVEVRRGAVNELRMLRLNEGDEIIAMRRSRKTREKIAKWEYSRLPFQLFASVDGWDGQESIESLALARGLQIASWDERVTLEPAPNWAAEEWGIEANAPVMRAERLLYDRLSRPLEWRVCYYEMAGRQYQLSSIEGRKPVFPEPKDG